MNAQCSICWEVFDCCREQNDEHMSATRCGHVFHEMCLSQWLKTSQTCPKCRTEISKKKHVIPKLFLEVKSYTPLYGLEVRLRNCQQGVEEMKRKLSEVKETKDLLMAKLKEVENQAKIVEPDTQENTSPIQTAKRKRSNLRACSPRQWVQPC